MRRTELNDDLPSPPRVRGPRSASLATQRFRKKSEPLFCSRCGATGEDDLGPGASVAWAEFCALRPDIARHHQAGQSGDGARFSVHHRNWNPSDNEEKNFRVLCWDCHAWEHSLGWPNCDVHAGWAPPPFPDGERGWVIMMKRGERNLERACDREFVKRGRV